MVERLETVDELIAVAPNNDLTDANRHDDFFTTMQESKRDLTRKHSGESEGKAVNHNKQVRRI